MHPDPYIAIVERIRHGATFSARFKTYEFVAKVDRRPGAVGRHWYVAVTRSWSPIMTLKIAGQVGFVGRVLEITHRAAPAGSPVARIAEHYRAVGAEITELK